MVHPMKGSLKMEKNLDMVQLLGLVEKTIKESFQTTFTMGKEKCLSLMERNT